MIKTAIDCIAESLVSEGNDGLVQLVGERYDVFDNSTVKPKVVRKGFATMQEACEYAWKYQEHHANADVVIISRITELKVTRLPKLQTSS